jgi:hypothetical protein
MKTYASGSCARYPVCVTFVRENYIRIMRARNTQMPRIIVHVRTAMTLYRRCQSFVANQMMTEKQVKKKKRERKNKRNCTLDNPGKSLTCAHVLFIELEKSYTFFFPSNDSNTFLLRQSSWWKPRNNATLHRNIYLLTGRFFEPAGNENKRKEALTIFLKNFFIRYVFITERILFVIIPLFWLESIGILILKRHHHRFHVYISRVVHLFFHIFLRCIHQTHLKQ